MIVEACRYEDSEIVYEFSHVLKSGQVSQVFMGKLGLIIECLVTDEEPDQEFRFIIYPRWELRNIGR